MTSRWAGAGVLLAVAVAGFAFAPAFGLAALLAPVLAVVTVVGAIDQVVLTTPRWAGARAALAAVGGSVAAALALTLPEPPWGAALRPVLDGAVNGWLRTLESTLPARPDPELLTFVPVLVLLASVVAVEWLRRGITPLAALAPALALMAFAQLYRAASGPGAVVLACGFGLALAVVMVATRGAARGSSGRRVQDLVVLALPVAVVAALGATALAVADPLARPTYSLQERHQLAEVPSTALSPLAELGGRLARPNDVAFTVSTDAAPDLWPLVVLDAFDGANWTSSARYRPLGAALPDDATDTAPTRPAAADVTVADGLGGPWLPTQFRLADVEGVRPSVDPATGVLVLPEPAVAAASPQYRLRWHAPEVAPDALLAAATGAAEGSVQAAELPAGIVRKAEEALAGVAPSFASALKLEKWFRDTYTVATGADLPTGHGTAQLLYFLNESKRGTSEQFATSYVLMASSAGIPARLVVGFRAPEQRDAQGRYVVHNRDAFAWPEVAVAGVGWVPLDPTGDARTDDKASGSVSQAAQQAREQLPNGGASDAPQPSPSPSIVPAPQDPDGGTALTASVLIAAVLALVLAAWLLGVPLAKWIRRSRRRGGPPGRAVVGAWLEARDLLRDHGVPVRAAMTVRDLDRPAAAVLNGSHRELERLARCVDEALWSGTEPQAPLADQAWDATAAIERAVSELPVSDRAWAAVRLDSLRRPRP